MNILIVDDLSAKYEAVRSSLLSCMDSSDCSVDKASSFISALTLLRTRSYDLLVLDLMLPIRDGEAPDKRGGSRVLAEILNGEDCLRPAHIICLTEYPDASESIKDALERSLVHIVVYDPTKTAWRDTLISKARYVLGRLNDETSHTHTEYRSEILIVTSAPHVEMKQVLELPCEFSGEFCRPDSTHYFRTEWTRADGKVLTVIACAAPSMGMTAACATASKAIFRFRPQFLVMTGIAAGTAKELNYGDILVAETAYDYGSGKILETDDKQRKFIPSPKQLNIDREMQALLQRWEREQQLIPEIHAAWETPVEHPLKMYMGILASGAAVVQSASYVESILQNSRKVVGLDMEGYAIFQAAALAQDPKPRVMVVKSVSDFADRGKNDNWQPYAAYTSARFVFEFFTKNTDIF